jgi:EAL domain-containing protein (putative c-di-GMP-specific phosphodiesterase class I)
MNITLSVDDEIVERARQVARRQGVSLNALVREFIEGVAGKRSGEALAKELQRQWKQGSGRSKGRKFTRDDLYAGRV